MSVLDDLGATRVPGADLRAAQVYVRGPDSIFIPDEVVQIGSGREGGATQTNRGGRVALGYAPGDNLIFAQLKQGAVGKGQAVQGGVIYNESQLDVVVQHHKEDSFAKGIVTQYLPLLALPAAVIVPTLAGAAALGSSGAAATTAVASDSAAASVATSGGLAVDETAGLFGADIPAYTAAQNAAGAVEAASASGVVTQAGGAVSGLSGPAAQSSFLDSLSGGFSKVANAVSDGLSASAKGVATSLATRAALSIAGVRNPKPANTNDNPANNGYGSVTGLVDQIGGFLRMGYNPANPTIKGGGVVEKSNTTNFGNTGTYIAIGAGVLLLVALLRGAK